MRFRPTGGAGVSSDFGLSKAYAMQRSLRIADGPDEVHARTIARLEMGRYSDGKQPRRRQPESDLLPVGSR